MSEQTQNTQQNEATKKQIKDLSSKGLIFSVITSGLIFLIIVISSIWAPYAAIWPSTVQHIAYVTLISLIVLGMIGTWIVTIIYVVKLWTLADKNDKDNHTWYLLALIGCFVLVILTAIALGILLFNKKKQ